MNQHSISQQDDQLSGLITDLGNDDGLIRQRARLQLEHLGKESILALLEALKNQNVNVRWEAVKALGEIHAPKTASALTGMLMDADTGARWTAMESLIRMGRHCLRPLLERFIKDFDSPRLREGTQHILHVLKDRHELNDLEITLFKELDKQIISPVIAAVTMATSCVLVVGNSLRLRH